MQVGRHERGRVEQAEPGHTQHAVEEMPGIVALQIALDKIVIRNFTRRRSVRSLVAIAHLCPHRATMSRIRLIVIAADRRAARMRLYRMGIRYYSCGAGWISICQATMLAQD